MTFAQVKQQLYVMRNGIVADSLRSAGCPYRLIWGLNLPQLREIAAGIGHDRELALALRDNADLRESRLLSFLIFPPEDFTIDVARSWLSELNWSEDADLLCFALLKKAPFAAQIAAELCEADDRLRRYAGLRLWLAIASSAPQTALETARREAARPDALTSLASMLEAEATFHLEEDADR